MVAVALAFPARPNVEAAAGAWELREKGQYRSCHGFGYQAQTGALNSLPSWQALFPMLLEQVLRLLAQPLAPALSEQEMPLLVS
jgi:hypothetical protein